MNDQPEPSYEAALTIGSDLSAVMGAVLSCIEAIQLIDESKSLTQPMRQDLENHWNVLGNFKRRLDQDLA